MQRANSQDAHLDDKSRLKLIGAHGAFDRIKCAHEAGEMTADAAVAACEMLLRGLDDLKARVPASRQSAAREARKTAWLVWQKTDGKCTYCAVTLNPFDRNADNGFHIDHVTPKDAGGTDDIDNLTPACRSCNISKGPRTPEQWEARHGLQ